jgi:serine-type D-Ala-D-Ala carboxypeptidase/endopeptidase (penicillin-binding protein 4)
VILFLVFLFSINIGAQETPQTTRAELKAAISPTIKKILKRNRLKEENLFYSLVELDSGETKEIHQHERPIHPASLTKIFTALYALEKLGAQYRFSTKVYSDGKIEDGVLKGNVYLVGGGDPSLTMSRLMDMVLELKLRGVKLLEGSFYYDDSSQPQTEMLSPFGLGDQTYNPGLSALNLEFNRFTMYRLGHRKTKRANFVSQPPLPHISIEKIKAGFSPGKRFHFAQHRPEENWQISQKEAYSLKESIPVRRSSRFTAETFRYFARLWSIDLPPARNGKLRAEAKLWAEDISLPLINLLSLTLEYSNNLLAEQILLKASQSQKVPEAGKKLTQWILKKVPSCKVNLTNGSGLSAHSLVNTHCFSLFLQQYALQNVGQRGFMSLLSISGQTGWLRNKLDDPATAYRVWAKTGSLDYVNNIAGVLFSNTGKSYSFGLGIQDLKKRNILNGKNSHRVDKVRRRASLWRKKSTQVLEELIKHWIEVL